MKVYLAHPISTHGEFADSIRMAKRIRALGYEVYAAAENASINDKSNEPRPIDIYNADIEALLSSDIVVANITGGHADGTICEIGAVAGYNEASAKPIKVVGYSSNARLLQPQFYEGVPSASANHLVLGAVDRWGEFVGNEDAAIKTLKELAE